VNAVRMATGSDLKLHDKGAATFTDRMTQDAQPLINPGDEATFKDKFPYLSEDMAWSVAFAPRENSGLTWDALSSVVRKDIGDHSVSQARIWDDLFTIANELGGILPLS